MHSELIVTEHPEQGQKDIALCQEYNLLNSYRGGARIHISGWLGVVSHAKVLILVHSIPLPVRFASPISSEKPGSSLDCSLLSPQLPAQGLETHRMGLQNE